MRYHGTYGDYVAAQARGEIRVSMPEPVTAASPERKPIDIETREYLQRTDEYLTDDGLVAPRLFLNRVKFLAQRRTRLTLAILKRGR